MSDPKRQLKQFRLDRGDLAALLKGEAWVTQKALPSDARIIYGSFHHLYGDFMIVVESVEFPMVPTEEIIPLSENGPVIAAREEVADARF